ncbi:DUF3658 domain-containing protein [Niabella hibiscisoli]|uniref:DUF3658 domain-containing protein n=1 Tax=Niabella hibiscisoli TaxID=1825928 RepID=UPI00293F5FC0|nr:DUF3658 domain-containing protein [Niabella hibiscisoli]
MVSREDAFYDAEILKNVTGEWQKASRVLQNTLNRMKVKTGDVFLMWRIKVLIEAGRIVTEGDVNKDWKSFDVKLPGPGKQMELLSELNENGE